MEKYYKTVYDTKVTGFFQKTFTEDNLPLGGYKMAPGVLEVEISKEEFNNAMELLSISYDEFYEVYGTYIPGSANGSGGIGTDLI